MAALAPRESSELISKASKHVTICEERVKALSTSLLQQMKVDKECIQLQRWKTFPLNPQKADESAVDWIFVVDALNFSFWSLDNTAKYMVRYAGSDNTGYWSLCAAINRALDEGIPITSAEYCKNVTIDQAKHIFRSDSNTQMPMIEERVKVMNKIGEILLQKFDGKAVNCVTQAEGGAQKLLRILVDNFACFKDEGVFNGQRVSFYKRAQILIADLWSCFEGKGLGKFADIDSITMFADYRIPQTLVYFNVMSYSEELTKLLQDDHMFSSGEVMEMEIRGASIWAVELLVKCMNELIKADEDMKGVHMNGVLLDHFLWDYRRKHDAETKHIPFHKIRCIYY